MLKALGYFFIGLIVIVLIIYTMRRFFLPFLGLPADVNEFVLFALAVLGLVGAIYLAVRAYNGTTPTAL